MKNVLILLLLSFFSCKTGQEVPEMATKEDVTQENMILSYAKGACLGNCPVYNLRIFEDGRVSYTGIRNVNRMGAMTIKLSKEEMLTISNLLKEDFEALKLAKIIRDRPVTSLKHGGGEYRYHSSQISGQPKLLNTKLEALVVQIDKAPQ